MVTLKTTIWLLLGQSRIVKLGHVFCLQ